MPAFRYSGYHADGRDTAGLIDAASINDAALKIKADGIFPSDISEQVVRRKHGFIRRSGDLFLSEITGRLSILLSAGVPIIDALSSLSAEHSGFYRDMITAIKERVAQGAGLHRAMEEFGDYFPVFYTNMVKAGEQSGALDSVLYRLSEYLQKQTAVKANVRSAMIYPIFMLSVSIVVLSFLFAFVIPKIVRIFENTGAALPFITRILIF
ncbi:MAG: type II secretion system F family protein, partial [Nitrospirae bacterium]|nr:type II secretion system F family protein [Nitrospirota bacterium]